MKLLLLLGALRLAGASPLKNNRVCQPQSRPWHVHLHGGKSCSGALIDKWWIVTSFSCAYSSSAFTASLGEHDVNMEEGTEQHISTTDIIVHSPYRSPLHSLAMVRLATPAQFNQYVQPIPLPSRCAQAGETCHVSGWGSTIPNQYDPSPLLKCITVPIVDDQTCRNLYPMYWGPGMVCAGQENTDNCLNEDSSVMVCDGQLQGVQWYAHGCSNAAHPSIYTNLCLYTDWITDVMNRFRPTETPPTTPTTKAAH